MFQYGIVAGDVRIEHQHADGSWATMEPRDPHAPAENDPEREWERGRVYVCTVCQEAIRIAEPEGAGGSESPGAA